MVPRLHLITKPAAKWITSQAKKFGISANEFVRRVLDEKRGTEK